MSVAVDRPFVSPERGPGGGGVPVFVCCGGELSLDNAPIDITVGVSTPKISMNNREEQAGLLRNRHSRC